VASQGSDQGLMTVGELARRTGLSAKAIRQFESRGLIYSAGRSEANYRLFDETALWCVQVVGNLRALGLTLKEIEELAVVYQDRPEEAAGPRLGALLERAQRRVEERLTELEALRRRIVDYRTRNAAALSGGSVAEAAAAKPHRRQKTA
jgi:MerR family copper efflux transcriptional regulator